MILFAVSDPVLVAVIAVVSPGILALLTGWQNGKSKREDWRRQDEVAKRQEDAAEKVSQVAAKAEEAAALLVTRQDASAGAAQQAAEDLVEANENLRRETRRAAALVNGKLDQIHTLVNSNLSAAMDDRLTAIRALIVALQQATDQSPAAVERIQALESTAIELEAQLADRVRQTRVAEAQVEQGAEGGLRAEWDEPEPDPDSE